MRKFLITAAALAAAIPGVANATFLVSYPSSQPVPGPGPAPNNFYQGLATFGITSFAAVAGTTITLLNNGPVKFEYFGREALLRNKFTAGSLSYIDLAAGTKTNHFSVGENADNTPFLIGTDLFTTAPGNFNPTFFRQTGGTVAAPTYAGAPAEVPGSANFGVGLKAGAPASGSFTSNVIWLLFDDNGQDDNHDDMIVRATFVVPEPSTWMMMLAGFGIMGLLMRSRRQTRVSFV